MPDEPRLVPLEAAQPRWSHRDPLEGRNLFPPEAPGHAIWTTATDAARDRLREMDTAMIDSAQVTLDPAVYRAQLFDLAVGRFAIWTERGISVISTEAACRDYERWLDRYVDNWLLYVAETCPGVEGLDELEQRLRELARARVRQARRAHVPSSDL
ncbi:MAG: hypothetical protein OSB03_07025 [Vicinamibacterales bacterium]|jgi:hypothetical protein|nr:hypothetical protein [Vicinamibacterales bacterium]